MQMNGMMRVRLAASAMLLLSVFGVVNMARADDCDPPRDFVQRKLESLCSEDKGCIAYLKTPRGACKATFYSKLRARMMKNTILVLHPDYEKLSDSGKRSAWEYTSISIFDVFASALPDLSPSTALKENIDAVEYFMVMQSMSKTGPGQTDITGTFGDGSYYDGKMRANHPDGDGTILLIDGAMMRGRFTNGHLNGLGITVTRDGQINAGFFINDDLVAGVNQLADGSSARAGLFANGIPMGLIEATQQNGTVTRYYMRRDAALNKAVILAAGPAAPPGTLPVSPPLPAGMPSDPKPPIWKPGVSVAAIADYSESFGGQPAAIAQRNQMKADAQAATQAAAEQARIAAAQAKAGAAQAKKDEAQAKADARKAAKAGGAPSGGGSGKSCMTLMYEYADVINSNNPAGSDNGGSLQILWGSAQFMRLAKALPVCRADTASMQLLADDLAKTQDYCRQSNSGGDCVNGLYRGGMPGGNLAATEAAYQRIVATNQKPGKVAASPASGKCRSEEDKLAATIRASTAKQNASDPGKVGTKGTFQHAMWVMSEQMRVLDTFCKSDPSYSSYAGYKNSYDQAKNSCIQVSSDNGASCVPKKMY